LGRFRKEEYDGGTCEESVEGCRGSCCDGVRDEFEGWRLGDGEAGRDRVDRWFNRCVRKSCSNRSVKSVALKSLCGCRLGGGGGGGGALRGGPL